MATPVPSDWDLSEIERECFIRGHLRHDAEHYVRLMQERAALKTARQALARAEEREGRDG